MTDIRRFPTVQTRDNARVLEGVMGMPAQAATPESEADPNRPEREPPMELQSFAAKADWLEKFSASATAADAGMLRAIAANLRSMSFRPQRSDPAMGETAKRLSLPNQFVMGATEFKVVDLPQGLRLIAKKVQEGADRIEALEAIIGEALRFKGGWREAIVELEDHCSDPVRLKNMLAAADQLDAWATKARAIAKATP